MSPLSEGKPGDHGTVASLAAHSKRQAQKLMAMGLLPGSEVRLIQRFPSYVFQVGYSQFAIDHGLAAAVLVRWHSHATSPKKLKPLMNTDEH